MIHFTIHGKPSTDHRPRFGRGRARRSGPYHAWVQEVAYTALRYCHEPLVGEVALAIRFYVASPDRVDLDNLAKGVLDGLNQIVYKDDRQVYRLWLSKHPANGQEQVEVTVWTRPELEDLEAWHVQAEEGGK